MLEILLYGGLGLLDSPRDIGLPTPWHKVIGTLCIVEAVDARYIPSIEIYNIIVCQNRVVERCPQQHERTSAGFVVNVAPESEIRLPITQKSEHVGAKSICDTTLSQRRCRLPSGTYIKPAIWCVPGI